MLVDVQVVSVCSGKLAARGVGSFAGNLARFAPRPLRFAHVPAICLDNPACSKSARLAKKVRVALRLFCDKQDRLRLGEMTEDSGGATVDGSPLDALNDSARARGPRLSLSLADMADMADFVQARPNTQSARDAPPSFTLT